MMISLKNPQSFFRPSLKGFPKGFTLIEILMIIVLAGIILPVIVAPFVTSVVRSEVPEAVATATFLAADKLEQLQGEAYGAIAGESRAAMTGNYSAFERQVTVTLVDSNLAASGSDVGYKQVQVTLFHNQLPGAGITLTSLYSNH